MLALEQDWTALYTTTAREPCFHHMQTLQDWTERPGWQLLGGTLAQHIAACGYQQQQLDPVQDYTAALEVSASLEYVRVASTCLGFAIVRRLRLGVECNLEPHMLCGAG